MRISTIGVLAALLGLGGCDFYFGPDCEPGECRDAPPRITRDSGLPRVTVDAALVGPQCLPQPTVPFDQADAECTRLETQGPRRVALSAAELTCLLAGHWHPCKHLAGAGLPFGEPDFRGIVIDPAGSFHHVVPDGAGGVVKSSDPGKSGTWKVAAVPVLGPGFQEWELVYGNGQRFQMYGVFSHDGGDMVAGVRNAGSVEDHFVRTQ